MASRREGRLPYVDEVQIINWKKKWTCLASADDVMTSIQKMRLSAWHASFGKIAHHKSVPVFDHRTLLPNKCKKEKNLVESAFFSRCINSLETTSRMVSFKLAALLLATAGSTSASLRTSRRLSFQSIAGYEPGSLVTDHVRFLDNKVDLTNHCISCSYIMQTTRSILECYGP
jgi:hypothetical protein